MTQKYRAASKDELVWHALDRMTLLFHRPSGITHMLADPVPAILEVMTDVPLSVTEIAARLVAEFDIASDDNIENIIQARLAELLDLGLVARLPG